MKNFFQHFRDMSLKAKLAIIFGVMIAASVIGIGVGLAAFGKVQVGGKAYAEIERDMLIADDIAKIRVNLAFVRTRLLAMMIEETHEKKQEHKDAIDDMAEIVAELFARVDGALAASGKTEARGLLGRGKEEWMAFKNTNDRELVPLVFEGKIAAAAQLARGIQAERYAEFLEATKESVQSVRADVPARVQKIKNASRLVQWAYVAGAGLFTLFIIFAGLFLSRTIVSPVVLVSRRSRLMAEGSFASDGPGVTRKDEIGLMLQDFTTMSARVSETASHIKTGVVSLSSASEELTATAENLAQGASEQSRQVKEVTTAAVGMAQSIMDVAQNAASAADAAKQSLDLATTGKDIVEAAAERMSKIADTVRQAAATIEGLGKSSGQIGEILTVINAIAEQTNLLALNAAIEAARAGEQGRGFAVVADEVRKLAERTAHATADIAGKISAIQAEAEKSVQAVRRGSEEVGRGVELAKGANESLVSIVQASSRAQDMVQRIATATEEQSSASEEITQNMGSIAEVIERSAEATNQIRQAAQGLAMLAADIKGKIEWFKTNGSPGRR